MIPDHPRLRPVDAQALEHEGERLVVLRDPFEITDAVLALPIAAAAVLNFCDGTRTIEDVSEAMLTHHRARVEPAEIRELLESLEEHTFLDTARYHEARAEVEQAFADAPVRAAMLAGRGYPDEADALRTHLDALFTHEDGPGAAPDPTRAGGTLRGAIIPHIDYHRGGPTYGHGYHALAAHADADLFVILGTGHGELHNLYTATWKAFETPFGAVPADTRFLDTVQRHVPFDLTADEFAHRGEHSIEFQAVLLQYLYAGTRDIRIVPILCGSFHHFVQDRVAPDQSPGVAGMTAGLRAAVDEARADGARVCFIASADLAHMGAKFGDAFPVDDARREQIAAADRQMLEATLRGGAPALCDAIHAVQDERRVCGYPCIYTMLSAMDASRGELLHYRQWPDPEDCVTFASAAFFE